MQLEDGSSSFLAASDYIPEYKEVPSESNQHHNSNDIRLIFPLMSPNRLSNSFATTTSIQPPVGHSREPTQPNCGYGRSVYQYSPVYGCGEFSWHPHEHIQPRLCSSLARLWNGEMQGPTGLQV